MKNSNLVIKELFMVKADFTRTFMGEISREKLDDGEVIRGNVVVNEGKIWSCSNSLDELGNSLDDLCKLKLDYGLNSLSAVKSSIAGSEFNHN